MFKLVSKHVSALHLNTLTYHPVLGVGIVRVQDDIHKPDYGLIDVIFRRGCDTKSLLEEGLKPFQCRDIFIVNDSISCSIKLKDWETMRAAVKSGLIDSGKPISVVGGLDGALEYKEVNNGG